MALWKNDQELFDIAKKELFVALVGDVLDKMGYQHQFLPPTIKPLQNDFIVIGRAMPVLEADVSEDEAKKPETQDRRFREKFIRLPLEAAGALGFVPFYGDVRKYVLDEVVYPDLRDGKSSSPKAKKKKKKSVRKPRSPRKPSSTRKPTRKPTRKRRR